MQKSKFKCTECNRKTVRFHPILDIPLCQKCQSHHKEKYKYITKTKAMGEYRLKSVDLEKLKKHEVDNPYYKKAAPMQLYMLDQIQELSKSKWGSPEPYIVSLANITRNAVSWLSDDLERLKLITPEDFQYLIAERLEKFGLEVQLVGNINRKDGGIDLIAYPKCGAFPFVMGVQVKHHRKNIKTKVGDIRDLHGAINSHNSPFHMGMLVTNTTFTPDAVWFANENKKLLRLRDTTDLGRWLQDDFVNENEWREIPELVTLAPGVEIEIPRQGIILP